MYEDSRDNLKSFWSIFSLLFSFYLIWISKRKKSSNIELLPGYILNYHKKLWFLILGDENQDLIKLNLQENNATKFRLNLIQEWFKEIKN
ncbi:hypothetical protein BpHYR1_014428 [Brachionus plicatilis]|uniref:Uncharacterized protein n=1 Tax=Brachionus plicatilis TaxID=10195 RepID=A0A3M7SJ82_BRAPC|nr:hypothetical protein BpHYR1_014428 [Brachionus plicatilis]